MSQFQDSTSPAHYFSGTHQLSLLGNGGLSGPNGSSGQASNVAFASAVFRSRPEHVLEDLCLVALLAGLWGNYDQATPQELRAEVIDSGQPAKRFPQKGGGKPFDVVEVDLNALVVAKSRDQQLVSEALGAVLAVLLMTTRWNFREIAADINFLRQICHGESPNLIQAQTRLMAPMLRNGPMLSWGAAVVYGRNCKSLEFGFCASCHSRERHCSS